MAKIAALKENSGNFDAEITISLIMKSELKWWFENVESQIRHINRGNPDVTIQTDSSKQGWGFFLQE